MLRKSLCFCMRGFLFGGFLVFLTLNPTNPALADWFAIR